MMTLFRQSTPLIKPTLLLWMGSNPALAEDTAPAPGEVYVSANVEGVEIFLDGEPSGQVTPAVFTDISPGSHSVSISSECDMASATFEVRSHLIERIELVMETGTTDLTVVSIPAGATVSMNGDVIGNTPLQQAGVACGEHEVVLTLDGHQTHTQQITAIPFEDQMISVAMEIESAGTLVVSPTPLTASVYLDEALAGEGPITLEQVAAGPHTLEVTADGYQSSYQQIQVLPDAITRLDIALEAAVSEEATTPSSGRGRVVVAGIMGGAGLGLAGDAAWNYMNARQAYNDYLNISDKDKRAADRLYNDEITPRKKRAAAEALGAAVLIGGGVILWKTSDVAVSATSNGINATLLW